MTYPIREATRFAPPPFKAPEGPAPIFYVDELISAASLGAFAVSLYGPAATILKEAVGAKGLYAINGILAITSIASITFNYLADKSPSSPAPDLKPLPDPVTENIVLAYKNKTLNKQNSHPSLFEEPETKPSTGSKISFSEETKTSHDKKGERPKKISRTPSGWILTKEEKRITSTPV
jgi:hypothetical protein